MAHALEIERLDFRAAAVADGDRLELEGLDARILEVPGHTDGQLNVHVEGAGVFTGDTLFAGSVGGTSGPGHGTFEQLRASILDVLLALPGETVVRPGHGGATTIARERETNPFVRHWRGLEPELDEPCTAFGREARLHVWARDYDGGFKAQVRYDDDGTVAVVPGSRVARRG
jgi:glyoxylase-like metal-dependent hydrolase (beta-lactamase superfamily II)